MVEQKEETTANLSSHDSASLLSYFKTSCDQPSVYILKYDNHSRGYVILSFQHQKKRILYKQKRIKERTEKRTGQE